MLALSSASLSFAPVAPVAPTMAAARTSAPVMETTKDLEEMADKLNPIFGYYNPLQLGDSVSFWDSSIDETIGFLRHAEIKHGRIAMFGFVGFLVQSCGVHWPGNIHPGVSYESIAAAGGPGAQWDAIGFTAQAQIIFFIFLMELVGESTYALEKSGEKHYMRGGKPGFFPSFKDVIPHPMPLDLFDPFGFSKKMTQEQKDKRLLMEINNGRWAMIGLIGALSATKGLIVPGMDSLNLAPYAGEYMKPFADFTSL